MSNYYESEEYLSAFDKLSYICRDRDGNPINSHEADEKGIPFSRYYSFYNNKTSEEYAEELTIEEMTEFLTNYHVKKGYKGKNLEMALDGLFGHAEDITECCF